MKTILLICFAIALFLSLIKKSKKRSAQQYESDVKENADFPEAVELESYSMSDFDKEIYNSWEELNKHKDAAGEIPVYTKIALFDFAEHYHKAKS